MYGGAITLAKKLLDDPIQADVIVVSSLLDVGVFVSLIRHRYPRPPIAVYFHENQLTYPWSPTDSDQKDGKDRQYMFTNYTSALTADAVWFNSRYHKESFLAALPKFLKPFPDHRNGWTVDAIAQKSSVLHLGLDLKTLLESKITRVAIPLIIWPHRWEHDKGPNKLLQLLRILKQRSFHFQLALTGQSTGQTPHVFEQIQSEFEEEIIQFGFLESKEAYYSLLSRADIVLSTAAHDFFGAAIVEGIAAGCFPILPNALAYPEHLPERFHLTCLYSDINQAADLIMNVSNIECFNIRSAANQYDWSEMIKQYDKQLEKLQSRVFL